MSLGLSLGLCVAPKVSLGLAGRALVEGGGWLMLEAGPQRADTPPGHSPAASLLTLQVPWGERRGGGAGWVGHNGFSLIPRGLPGAAAWDRLVSCRRCC